MELWRRPPINHNVKLYVLLSVAGNPQTNSRQNN